MHGLHGCKHCLRHLLWGQRRLHFLTQGGHGLPQVAWQRCEHTRTRLHGFWHISCDLLCLHSPHVPEHSWPHGSWAWQEAGHCTSSTEKLQGILTLWPHGKVLTKGTWQGYLEHGSPQNPLHLCVHPSRRGQGALQVAVLLSKQGTCCLCPQPNSFTTLRLHKIAPQAWLQTPGHGWPQSSLRSQRARHATIFGSSLQNIFKEWFPGQFNFFTTKVRHLYSLHFSKHFPGHWWPQDKIRVHGFEQTRWETSSEQRQSTSWCPQRKAFLTPTAHLKLAQSSPHLFPHGCLHGRMRSHGALQIIVSALSEQCISFSWPQGSRLFTFVLHLPLWNCSSFPEHVVSFLCPQESVISTFVWQQYWAALV